MSRLPTVAGDNDGWGTILNDYLSVAHRSDGTPKTDVAVVPFDAAGDDATDDYASMQATLDSVSAGAVVVGRKNAVYRLSNTLTPPSGITIDFNGAVVKAGATRSGRLSSNDNLIYLSAKNKVVIKNGRFLQPISAFGGSSERSLILLDASTYCVVTRCEFTISSGGEIAVRLRNGADDCEVSYNELDGYGIMYAQARDSITGVAANGTNRTRILFNRIINSPVDGLKALGNGLTGVYCDDCQVIGNIIINAGRMGIEDFQQTRGSIIAENHVSGTGVVSSSLGIGISAASSNTLVQGNKVSGTTSFGIECGSHGARVVGNNIDMSAATVAMSVDSEGKNSTYGATIEGNVIKGGTYGIRSASASPIGSVTITANHIYDWSVMGIDCAASSGFHAVIGNTLSQSTQNNTGATRVGINGGTNSPVIGNIVTFRSSASGGSDPDKLCQLFRDNQMVSGNTFDAGGITSPAVPTVNAAGGAPTDISVMHNTFAGGATLNVSTITRPRVAHNVGLSTISGTPTIGFFNVTPIARPSAYTQTYSTADKTLAAYTPDVESSAYTGAADGEAQLADLNALRVAYENLRAFVEDLAQHHNSVLDDLQAYGLLQ